MKKYLSITLLGLVLTTTPAVALTPVHQWSKGFGDGYGEYMYELTIDGSGNVIVVGEFDSPLDLGGGPLNPAGGLFIAKFATDGAHLWSKELPGGDSIRGLTTDGAGNIVISGGFYGTLDLGVIELVAFDGGWDAFLVKFDPDGNPLWGKRFGTERAEYGFDVAVDNANNLFLSSTFDHSIDLGGGTLVCYDKDVFLAKFDAAGNHIWSKHFSGLDDQLASVTATSNGDVLLHGRYRGNINQDTFFHTSAGNWDVFVSKFNATGACLWSKSFGNPDYDGISGLVLDSSDRAVMLGSFFDSIDFGGGPLVSPGWDTYLAMLGSDGSQVWSRRAGGSGHHWGGHLGIDGVGNLMIADFVFGDLNLGGETMSSTDGDVYLSQLDPNGNFLWNQMFPGPEFQLVMGIATADDGATVLTGYLNGSVDFGGGPIDAATYEGDTFSEKTFLVRFAPQAPTSVTEPRAATTLMQNYPNPFNPTTTIEFVLNRSANVAVEIFDATGARVARLSRGILEPGTHRVEWSGRDNSGRAVGSGVYFYRLKGVPGATTRKMVLLK